MPESSETVGYAPSTGVLAVIEKARQHTITGPVDAALVKRIGVPDSLVKRTLNSLRFLGLVESSGATTPTFDALVSAHPNEYEAQFAEVVRAAYSKVFAIVDPATASPDQIRNAFWGFEPRGQTDNMIRLFLALCEEAGIVQVRPKVEHPPKPKQNGPSRRPPKDQKLPPPPPPPDLDGVDPTITSWVKRMPPTTQAWPKARRDQWFVTLRALVDGIWPEQEDDS